jgi:hypothetical protein
MTEHWHYSDNADEPNESVYTSVFHALEASELELDTLLDYEIQCITAMGDNGDFEGAYRAYQRSQVIGGILDNVCNMVKQYESANADRAPLYRADWTGEDNQDEADARLLASAEHVTDAVNSDTPLSIWRCYQDCDIELYPGEEGYPDHTACHCGKAGWSLISPHEPGCVWYL